MDPLTAAIVILGKSLGELSSGGDSAPILLKLELMEAASAGVGDASGKRALRGTLTV